MKYQILHYIICSLTAAGLLVSCATTTGYYDNLNKLVVSHDYSKAVALAEREKETAYGKRNALLYYLDRGLLFHFNGEYKLSNIAFEKAKRIAQEHFTKSITLELSTYLISDNMRPYYGEDFERALIHVFCALNYVFLGQETEALVEARQVDHFLKTIKVNYGHKNVYTEDAFIRYLIGMLYENQGQDNDAFISYRKALDAYSNYKQVYRVNVPGELIDDALRTAKKLGFSDEAWEIESKWKPVSIVKPNMNSQSGELVVLHYNGFSPVKIDHFFEISLGKGWTYVESIDVAGKEQEQVEKARAIARSITSDEQIRLAFPKYIPVNYRIKKLGVSEVGTSKEYPGSTVENIGAIAAQGLKDRINRIRTRTIARGVVKFVLTQNTAKKVKQKKGKASAWFVKTLLNVVSASTEMSDKRSWQLLPDKINMARIFLKEGAHSIKLQFYDQTDKIVYTKILDNIRIRKGKKTFISVRTAK